MSNRIGITLEALLGPIKTQINKFKSDTQKDLQESSKVPLKIKEDDLLRVKKEINTVKGEIAQLNAQARNLNLDIKARGKSGDLTEINEVTNDLVKQKNKLAELRVEQGKLESQNLPGYFSNLSSKLGDTIKRIGLFTAAFTIINQTKNAIVGVTQASIAFESALAGVNKTTDFTASELQAIDKELRRLSTQTPLTYVELAKITELGGQIGVAKENLVDFTETMAMLQTTTNLTSEESINNFAKFNNVMGISGKEIKKIASVLVELGNNSAATETEILTFSNRVSAAGKLSGISASGVMAISAAFVSAGIQAEAGGTAVSSVLSDINKSVVTGGKNLEIYAATAGQTSEEFAKSWREDADSAFAQFIDNLGEAGDEAYNILGKLEQDNVRTLRAFLATANSAVTVKDMIALMREELEDTDSLYEEFNKRLDTTETKLKIQRNQWTLLGLYLGDELAPILEQTGSKLLEITTKALIAWQWLAQVARTSLAKADVTVSTTKEIDKINKETKKLMNERGKLIRKGNLEDANALTQEIDNNTKRVQNLKQSIDDRIAILDEYKNEKALELKTEEDVILGKGEATKMAFEQELKDKKDKIEKDIKLLEEQLDKENTIGGSARKDQIEEAKKLREEELKAIEEDNKKRADYLDNYNEKQLKSSKKTAEGVIKITQKQLDYQLEIIATAQGEELEQAIDLADKLKAIIKKNTDYVEDKVQQEKEIYENAADYIEELLDKSEDKIDDLQKQLDKLQEIGKSQDEKIAERRLKIEKEIADTKETIAEFDKNAVYWASQLNKEQLKSIGSGILGTGSDGSEITGDSVLKAQEELNKLNELEKELIENSEYLKQSVYEEKLAYDAKSETMKIVADMREKEKETLADLGLEYETAEEAIKGIEEAIKAEQEAREVSLAIQSNLTKQFTTLLGEETDKQIIFQNKFQEAVQASINKQRELNALLGASREASNNSASNNSNQVVNITNNINGAGNVNDTARKVTSAEALALRGSTPSSNS